MKNKPTSNKEKTSLYIDKDLIKRMKPFLVKTKKTDFINESIEKNVKDLEREKAKKEALEFLRSIKPVKCKKTSLELIHEAREERMKTILGKNYKKPK